MSYWITSLGLIAFGVVGMFSIGRPFFLIGMAMLIWGPLRRRPALYCTATQAVGGTSTTVCSSLVGIGYLGSGLYNPSLELANQAGLLTAFVAFVVVLAAILWKGRPDRVAPPGTESGGWRNAGEIGLTRLTDLAPEHLVPSGPAQEEIRRPVSPRRALATAGIGPAWIVGYLLIIQSQRTEMGSPGVVFYTTFVGVMAVLSLGAAVIRDRNVRWAQTLLYAAAGGYLPAGFLGLASVGLPLIVAGLLALAAAGPRIMPVRLGVATAALSASAFLVGFAFTIRVS